MYMYADLPISVIVTLSHPQTFLAPPVDKLFATMKQSTQNTISPNHHKAMGLSRNKIK